MGVTPKHTGGAATLRKRVIALAVVIMASLSCATQAPKIVGVAGPSVPPTLACADGSFECGNECCSRGWRCCTDSNGRQYCGNNNCPN